MKHALIIAVLVFLLPSQALAVKKFQLESNAAPDQVLVLYNADMPDDSGRELAEYYQRMYTDPATGKKPLLLGLTCVHGKLDKHLNKETLEERSNDNTNGVLFTGEGRAPANPDWILDSSLVEITVPEEQTDWSTLAISVNSLAKDEFVAVWENSAPTGVTEVAVSGPPEVKGWQPTYPPMAEGKERCFRFDASKLFPGTVWVHLEVKNAAGQMLRDLKLAYYDRNDFIFSATGNDQIPDDLHLMEDILGPVKRFLEDPANAPSEETLLKDHILYIVLIRGLPYAVKSVFGLDRGATPRKSDHGSLGSLDQRLQTLYYDWETAFPPPVMRFFMTGGPDTEPGVGNHIITTGMRYPLMGPLWNPFVHPNAYAFLGKKKKDMTFYPVAPFLERRTHNVPPYNFAYAVTRIEGQTVEDGKRIIDYSLYASKHLRPEMDCLVRSGQAKLKKDLPEDMDRRLKESAKLWGKDEITHLGFRPAGKREEGLPLLEMPEGAAAGQCEAKAEPDWKKGGFYPGGLDRSVGSSNGYNNKKSQIWQMIEKGVTASSCGSPAYGGGPHITNTTFWDNFILQKYLLRGKDFGEAALLTSYHIDWSTSFLGDPLFHPDLNTTTVDTSAPVPAEALSVEVARDAGGFVAVFAATLKHSREKPEVAVLRVTCKEESGEAVSAHTPLYSARPTARVTGLKKGASYRCEAILADPYENQTRLEPVSVNTAESGPGGKE